MMGDLVVDSNSFDYPDLTEYLEQSGSNRLVLVGSVLSEAFHGDPVENAGRKLLPLRRFVSRVVILKNSTRLFRLHGRSSGLRKRLVNQKLTKLLPVLLDRIESAGNGDAGSLRFVQNQAELAYDVERRESLARGLQRSMRAIAADFTKSDVSKFRAGVMPSAAFADRYFEHLAIIVLDVAESLGVGVSTERDVFNTFLLRFALFYELLVLERVWYGSQFEESTKRFVNDMADTEVIAAASFFDRIATKDVKMQERLRSGMAILQHLKSLN